VVVSRVAQAERDRVTADRAVTMLVDHHADSLYRVAHALTGSVVHTDAVMRDVLLRALQHALPSPDPDALRLVLYRLTVDAARGKRPTRIGADELDGPRFAADGHRIEEGVRWDWSALAEADVAAVAQGVIRDTVRELPDALAVALVLADGERLSPAEIAEVTGVPIPVAGARVHQARMILRERINRRLARVAAA
jgi:DNA-directed RNA polymerase specialized sigma24 family protein